jgi:preprotein translocase subunit SecG
MDYLLLTVLGLTSFLLMGIVLLQRGRGGGLAGAFGGLGGQSAFGTKAGDVFTKITIGITVFWVFLAGGSGFALRYYEENGNFRGGKDATPEKSSLQSTDDDDDETDDEDVKKKTIDDAFPIDKPTTKPKKTDKAEVDDTKKPADKPDADKPDADKPDPDKPKTDKPTKTDSKTEKPSPNEPAKDDAKSKPPVKKGDDGKKPTDKTEKKDTKPAKTDNDKAGKTD